MSEATNKPGRGRWKRPDLYRFTGEWPRVRLPLRPIDVLAQHHPEGNDHSTFLTADKRKTTRKYGNS